MLLRSLAHPELVGLDFVQIGRQLGVDPFDAVFDLLLAEGEGLAQLLDGAQLRGRRHLPVPARPALQRHVGQLCRCRAAGRWPR